MKKTSIILVCTCVMASCATGIKEKETTHLAYVHQVIEQSQKEKVVLANVSDVENNGLTIRAKGVKLILQNCAYEDEWTDDNTYYWTGTLENTHKAFSYTDMYGIQKTVPVYIGDCNINDMRKN